LIVFNGVKEAKVEYDLGYDKGEVFEPAKDLSKVSYHLELDPLANNDPMEKRYLFLEQSVRNLFWQNLLVKIFIADKLVYESKK
jgi:hypothetical protein